LGRGGKIKNEIEKEKEKVINNIKRKRKKKENGCGGQ
jgi:hypothetical protein